MMALQYFHYTKAEVFDSLLVKTYKLLAACDPDSLSWITSWISAILGRKKKSIMAAMLHDMTKIDGATLETT